MRVIAATVGLGLLAVTVSCGGRDEPRTATATAAYHGCSARTLTAHSGRVARADLDGDGRDEPVRLVRSGRCAGSLVVVRDEVPTGMDVRDLRLRASGAQVVHLRGGRDLVVVRSRAGANGLSQPHLFGQVGQQVREVTRADGTPVLPALRTRGTPTPHAATCTSDGGIAVTEARTHEPPGIVLAWDVSTTTYDLRAGRATRTSTTTLRAVAEPVLREQHPQLYAGGLFDDCG